MSLILKPTSNTDIETFLPGGGDMGKRIRTYEWKNTPLGDIANWPQSLLTSLSIMLNSKFPMLIWWGKDCIQFYNDAYRPSLGSDGQRHPQALGQKCAECWQNEWSYIKPMIDKAFSGESTWSENQLVPVTRNGKLENIYWTFSYSPIRIEGGSIGGVLVVCTETTDVIVNLNRIEESENKLRFAIDSAELGTWDYNPATNKFDGNSRLKEWFGLESQSEIDLPAAIKIIAPQDRTRVFAAIQKALEYSSGGIYHIEYTIIHPHTKKERIVIAKGRAWFNEDKVAYRFNGTLQDVTEEVHERKKNEQIQNDARIVSDRLQLALEAGEIGYYELTLATYEMTCNNLYKKIFGFSDNHQPTYKEFETKILVKDRPIRKRAIDKAIQTNTIYSAEYRVLHPDEEIRWIKSFGKAVYDDYGKAVKLIGMTLDITEHKQFAEELSKQVQERTAELKRTNADLLQFAHVASHDLKEPVRKVKIFSGRIRDEFKQDLPETVFQYLDKIQHATDRMLSMIEGVLMYSTLTNLNQAMEQVNLNDIISSIEKDLEILIEEKHAVVKKEKLPVITGVPVLMYQLFYNLINNALKFSKDNEESTISISCITEKIDSVFYSRISIEDNGIGFSNEYIDKMFEAFIRLNSKDKYEGTGLGLALCKKIVERHNGKIYASGENNKGAVFTILLPLSKI